MDETLRYYAENSRKFASETAAVDFSAVQERFLALLPRGASILDFGCGSGRDTKAFLSSGFRVTAVDGSPELCALASAYTGIPVRQMLFTELDAREEFDGIWACASVLHVPPADLPDVFRRMSAALRPGGFLYVSFKYGTFAGIRNGRFFTDFTEETFSAFLQKIPSLTPVSHWISPDARPSRSAELWLNVILRNVPSDLDKMVTNPLQ